MIIGFIVQFFWVQLCDLSFLTINSMISMSPRGAASVIQAVMLKYAYFDVFYTEKWMDQSLAGIGLETDEVQDDQALSLELENNGFGSK